MRLQRYFMALPNKKKPLGHRHCRFSGCKALFQPTNARQFFCQAKCRFLDWSTGKQRAFVTRLEIDEQAAPTIWHAVTTEPDAPPLAIFRQVADAIEYGKTHARAKHQITRIELRLSFPSKSRH